MLKKIIIIAAMIITITLITIIYGFKQNKQSYNKFYETGYIITRDEQNYSTKYYFDANAKYKENYSQQIIFDDVNNSKVKVDKKNFVHYTNGSVSALDKSVILNLEEINAPIIPYYNMNKDIKLENTNGKYTIKNLNKELELKNFIIKISDNKYMVISNDMILKLDDEREIKTNGYYEITYIDENIIRIENQEKTYQTISSNASIKINDITIDLSQKSVFSKEERKLEFSQMVINSDDNIELTDLPEKIEKDEPDNPEKKPEDINIDYGKIEQGTNNNNSGSIISNGNINGTPSDDQKNITDENTQELPQFFVTDLETTTNLINANIQITDNNGMLTNDTTTKIIENGTGKIIYMITTPNGTYDIPISVDNLKPDTDYTLIAQATYKKDNIEYKNDFISKIFRTESLGIDIEKDYFTTNSLSLNIKISEYSNIQNFRATLTDENDNTIKTLDIDTASFINNKYNITFNELQSNTRYKVVLSNFMYEGLIMGANYNKIYEYKTLKEKPTLNGTIYSINKKESTFTLALGNLKDPDNGIETYRYEIYDASQLTETNIPEPIATIKKSQLTSIDLKIDEKTLYRGKPYVFKVICEFNDNEKIIEYETEYSNIFKMEGVEYPTLSFQETNITFERIQGKIIIDDPGRTIKQDSSNIMKIVYKNSIGITESFEYYGNLIIPFDKNNLRAGETYTISVYGTVDLQDGNGPIYCLIGTAVVNTPNTQPLQATWNQMFDVNKSFKINAKLESTNDEELEANTLTGITFNLYSGVDTTGPLVKSVKKLDSDIAPYTSNLKSSYYDNTFEITPQFFGLENADIKGNYTIEITNAYDYTRYENPIDINTNVITLQSNGVIPDLPEDINNCIEVQTVRNNNLSNGREDLNAETLVAYKIRAGYDNSSRFLKYIKYYVYDADTHELLTPGGIISDANSDGSINYTQINLQDGIEDSTSDKKIRRGKRYYFRYEAYLDLDKDNNAETIYPQVIDSNVILRSIVYSAQKQEPKILIYPASSTNNTSTWKYNIKDIDKTIVDNTFEAYIDDIFKNSQIVEINKESYETLTFNNMKNGILKIQYNQTLIKNNSQAKQLIEQKFEEPYELPELKYHINQDVNKITISLNDYEQNKEIYDRIAALKIKFITAETTKEMQYVPLQQGKATIDLTQINELINKEITVEVSAYYDSGITGYEIDGLKAIEFTDPTEKKYIALTNNIIEENETAENSIFDTTFNLSTINITSKIYGTTKSLPITITSSGVHYNYNPIVLKKITQKTLNCDEEPIFTFDKIIPGVSLLNNQGQLNISTTLTEAKLNININGANASSISDDKIYIELYKSDDSGTSSELIKTLETTTQELKNPYTIEELEAKTNYYIKIYANLITNNGIELAPLYDTDYKTSGKIYYFKTLSKVGIKMKDVSMNYASYLNKTLNINYELDNISGIKTIEYKIYKYDRIDDEYILNDTPIDFGLTNDIIPQTTMNKSISCHPRSNCEYGAKYKIEIIPYAEVDSELVKLDDDFSYEYTIPTPTDPFIWIKSTYENSDIVFKVSVIDQYKMIVEGKYRIKLYEIDNDQKTDITPEEINNKEYTILELNHQVRIESTNINENKQYELEVITYIDRENKIEPTELYTKSERINSQNVGGIYLGDVYTTTNNSNPQKIDILFYNSNRLTEIDEIRYSIYNSTGYAKDNIISFNPIMNPNNYTFTLPELLDTKDVYYIEMQFLQNKKIIKQLSIEYAYR